MNRFLDSYANHSLSENMTAVGQGPVITIINNDNEKTGTLPGYFEQSEETLLKARARLSDKRPLA